MQDLAGPLTIRSDMVYTDQTLEESLGLSRSALARARREEGLKHTRKGQKHLYLGVWILEWLAAGACQETDDRQALELVGA